MASTAIFCTAVTLLIGFGASPGTPVVGDVTPALVQQSALKQLEPGDEIIQSIVATQDRFAAVEITFGTYLDTSQCDLRIELRGEDGDRDSAVGPLLAQEVRDCSALPDTVPTIALTFSPIDDSAGDAYDVVIRRTDTDLTPGVTVWSGSAPEETPVAVVDGVPAVSTAMVRGLYDPEVRRWDQIGLLLHRMAVYGPAWASPGAFCALVVLLVLLVAAVPFAIERPKILLGIVIVAALARGLLWSAIVPVFSAMDEPAHFSNVQYLAVEGALPGRTDDEAWYSDQVDLGIQELHLDATPPGDRPSMTESGELAVSDRLDNAGTSGGGSGPATSYPVPYYLIAVPFMLLGGDSFFGAVAATRLWSVVLGTIAAVMFVLLARRLFPKSAVAQGAFALAGVLHPMAGHQFAVVNNDAWVILFGLVGLLVSLRLVEPNRAMNVSLMAGLVLGGALLGKPFGVAVAAPLLVGWLIGAWRRGRALRAGLVEAALFLGGLATYGIWLVIAWAAGVHAQTLPTGSGERSLRVFLLENVGRGLQPLREVWGSQFWGRFGWVDIAFPKPVIWVLFIGLVIVGLASAVWVLRTAYLSVRTRNSGAQLGDVDLHLLVVISQLVGMVGTLYAAAWLYYMSSGRNDLLQGRYALMALGSVLAAPALLADRFAGARTVTPVLVGIAGAMGCLTLVGFAITLVAFYG